MRHVDHPAVDRGDATVGERGDHALGPGLFLGRRSEHVVDRPDLIGMHRRLGDEAVGAAFGGEARAIAHVDEDRIDRAALGGRGGQQREAAGEPEGLAVTARIVAVAWHAEVTREVLATPHHCAQARHRPAKLGQREHRGAGLGDDADDGEPPDGDPGVTFDRRQSLAAPLDIGRAATLGQQHAGDHRRRQRREVGRELRRRERIDADPATRRR